MTAANEFLRNYWIPYHNKSFTLLAQQQGTAFVPYTGKDLNKIFSRQEERVVGNDNTVEFAKQWLQIEPQNFRCSMAKCRVLVCQHLDGTISVHYGPHLLGSYEANGQLIKVDSTSRRKRKAA